MAVQWITRRVLAVLAVVAALGKIPYAESKSVQGVFLLEAGDFDTGPEYEITKFTFTTGKGLVEGKFRFRDPRTWQTSPALYMFNDDSWDDYHNAPSCMDKVKFADAAIPIGKMTQSHTGLLRDSLGKASSTDIEETEDGFVEWKFKWEIEHSVRTYGWFFIAADCALEQFNARVTPMTYEIRLLNPGNTHLPADEYGLPKVYLFVFLGMICYGAFCAKLLYEQYSKSKKVHLVIKLLSIAYLLQLYSLLFELIHLYCYKFNGYGFHFFDVSSEITEGLSQTTVAFVLICLACGWTLVDDDVRTAKGNSVVGLLNNPSRMLEGANVVVAGVLAFVGFSFLLQIWNKSFDDDFSKFHDHESLPGKILVVLRLLLGIGFIVSLHFTIRQQEKRGGDRLLAFLKRLMRLGGTWFLSFPLVVLTAGLFPHYLRHRFVSTSVIVLQTFVLCFLGYQFMSEQSTYFKLSTLADSGVLPGAGGLVRPAKMSKD